MSEQGLTIEQGGQVVLDAAMEERGVEYLRTLPAEYLRAALDFVVKDRKYESWYGVLVDATFPDMEKVVPKETTKTFYDEPKKYARYKVTKGQIRICGIWDFGWKKCKVFDRTFKVGDTVEISSYNLIYTGPIISIGKTVKVRKDFETKSELMPIYNFVSRNHNLDLAWIAEHNAEVSMHI